MKITNIGPTTPLFTITSLDAGTGGGTAGTVLTSTGSNGGTEWLSNVQRITANGSNILLSPFVNFANGSNVWLTLDSGPGGSIPSNTIRIHSTGGGGSVSYGSNASTVAEIGLVGVDTAVARADHYHAGIGTVTASSSNTMQRGTLNLRPGNGVALNLTDTDGDGEFDTITVATTGSGGGGSGAPTSAKYVTTASDGTLTAEVVIPGLAGSADIPVGGGSDDEFDSTSLGAYTTIGSPTTMDSNTTVKSHLYIKHSSASPANEGIYLAKSTPFTVVAKVAGSTVKGTAPAPILGIMESTSGKVEFLRHGWRDASNAYVYSVSTQTTPTTSYTNVVPGATPGVTIPQPVYLKIVATSSTNVSYYISGDGNVWTAVSTGRNPGFTIAGAFLGLASNATGDEVIFDFWRFS